ncbi:5-amino-6-(5-phospho-d-ribitylamino)uracil phosphatase, partial [Quercus suber]
LDRKPSKCVVFEDDPRGITAAHNCTMMAIALIGAHPAYDLGQADLAVAGFNELSVINLRRLFANNVRCEIYSEVRFLWFNIRGWKSCSGLGGDPRRFMARAYI